MTDDLWLTEHEQLAWRSFYHMQARLLTRVAQHLQREADLSMADYEVLVHLARSSSGYLRAFELGEATQWEKSRLSHHLTRMAARGLVRREACTEDSRYANIVLTEAGRTALDTAAPQHVAHVRSFFVEALDDKQLDALTDACQAVLARLDDLPDPAAPERCPLAQPPQPAQPSEPAEAP